MQHWRRILDRVADALSFQKELHMDDRGHWHESPTLRQLIDSATVVGEFHPPAQRPAIEIEIGETVMIVKDDGATIMASFDAAEKNKVTLTPQKPPTPEQYLELAEPVQLARANGESIRAQVWDNRGGKIVLRTLPVHG
jgi:hypothetical protein